MKPTYAELETALAKTKEKLACAEEKIDQQASLLREALGKITELEERLKLNSKNSSKPPSSDKKGNTSGKNKKKRPPRKGHSRSPFSADRVDHQVKCTRDCCAHCGSEAIDLLKLIPDVLQQVELPEARAIVTEYLLLKYNCHSCGRQSKADLPSGIPNSAFGPKLMGLYATLTGVFHLAKREAIQLVKDLYEVEIGLGSSSNIEERVANALDPVCDRIQRVVMSGKFCRHFDETGWRNGGKRRYAWVASCDVAAYYRIDPSRSREAFRKLINSTPEKLERVVTDRYSAYITIGKLHQYCLAHLIRDFQRFADKQGADAPIGEALAKEFAKACKIHGEYRESKITKTQRNQRLGHLKRRVESWLYDGLANGSDKLFGVSQNLLDNFDKLWTFTKVEGMEPTNNLAERDLRKLVIWRKKSYGTRSARGEKFVEKITSVAETLKRHKRNILTFIQEAITCFYRNELPPQICPTLSL